MFELLREETRHLGSRPVAERVAGTARPAEDVVGVADPGDGRLALDGIGIGAPERGNRDGVAETGREVVDGRGGDVGRVLLEAVRRVEERRPDRRPAKARQHDPVGRRHR